MPNTDEAIGMAETYATLKNTIVICGKHLHRLFKISIIVKAPRSITRMFPPVLKDGKKSQQHHQNSEDDMKFIRARFFFPFFFFFISCSSTKPMGPKVAIMPAPGKPFDVFVMEDKNCRAFAEQSIASAPSSARRNAAGTVVAGTALGTAAGALIGGREGASVGAGVGLIGGSAGGAGEANLEARDIQWSYDNAYAQCMYSKGNQVPGYQYQPAVPPPKK